MITREFKLYLNAGVGVAPVINANQFDQDEEWIFTLLQEDGTVYTPSTGAIIGLKTDGTTILNAGTVNSSGQVVITETEQMTAVPGSNVFELLIDGNTHGTANFVVFVERRPGDIDNPSESDISLFQEAIDAAGNIEQFQADISALQSGLATTNANLTSEANTRASADATLQSNISAEASTRQTQDAVLQAEIDQIIAPTGEAPSAAEVQNARIGVDGTTYDTLGNAIRGQVGDLKNAINFADEVSPIKWIEGYYLKPINGKLDVDNPTPSSTGWSYGIVSCQPNDKFCVNGESYNGQYPLAWYFLDASYNILSNEAHNVVVTNKMLNAPANSAYLVVHTKTPTILSYKGSSVANDVKNVSNDLQLYKRGKEPFEMGGLNDTNGFLTSSQIVTRIRSTNYLSLDAYDYFTINYEDFSFFIYAYDSDFNYLGNAGTEAKLEWYASEVISNFPTAKYIKILTRRRSDVNVDLSPDLQNVQENFVIKRAGGSNPGSSIPELTSLQKQAIKSLADDYYTLKGNFNYLSSATMNSYASSNTAQTGGKYKICCSLLAMLLWMGRDANDFSDLSSYSNAVTKEFDFGYYFQFAERALYGKKPTNGYYGFHDPFNDNYAGSYSWNSYYNAGVSTQYKQMFNEFMYANDMAKEMERLGYTIPMSELQTGDLIFTKYPTFDPKTDTFDAIAYKNINHVAIVYEKTPTSITIIESTPRFTDAIHKSSSTGTDEEKVRIGYLLSQAVCFARHPAAWGDGGNVPTTITTR